MNFFDRLQEAVNTPEILMSPADHSIIAIFAIATAVIVTMIGFIAFFAVTTFSRWYKKHFNKRN